MPENEKTTSLPRIGLRLHGVLTARQCVELAVAADRCPPGPHFPGGGVVTAEPIALRPDWPDPGQNLDADGQRRWWLAYNAGHDDGYGDRSGVSGDRHLHRGANTARRST